MVFILWMTLGRMAIDPDSLVAGTKKPVMPKRCRSAAEPDCPMLTKINITHARHKECETPSFSKGSENAAKETFETQHLR